MESTISSYLGFMFSNKPMSRLDSDPDYLLTQYISDFAKYLGDDGVKYFSTFD